MNTRCVSMYLTAPACFRRSGVTKMPLITASHFFALRAGMRPGNAVFTGFAVAPNVFASAEAMSTSKPLIAPLEATYSIGGNDGSVQYVKLVAARLAATDPAEIAATAHASARIVLRIRPPS